MNEHDVYNIWLVGGILAPGTNCMPKFSILSAGTVVKRPRRVNNHVLNISKHALRR